MKQYGQAEYAEAVLNSIAEKLWKAGILTEQQYKQLCKQNHADCYRQFCICRNFLLLLQKFWWMFMLTKESVVYQQKKEQSSSEC